MVVAESKSSSQLLLPSKKLSNSDYFNNLKLFYRNIENLKIIFRNNLDYLISKIKGLALTSFRNYNANISQHLSTEKFEALKNFSANCNLVTRKGDKGNSVALVEKDVYMRYMENVNAMDNVRYVKLSFMFVHNLDLYF